MKQNNGKIIKLKNGIQQPAKQKSAPEIVANKLIQKIESKELNPGQKLPPQSELSKLFKVGMSSIREAVNVLEVMGYIDVIHGSGTFVSSELPMNKTLMEKLEDDILHASTYELFELREVIECHAVRQAARRADPLSIDRIKSAYEALRQSTSDRQSFLECDLNFHLTISKAIDLEATASFIYFIFEIMHKQFDLVATTQTTEYREKAVSSAGHVVSAIMTGDDALAVRCMRRHLDSAKHALRNNDAD